MPDNSEISLQAISELNDALDMKIGSANKNLPSKTEALGEFLGVDEDGQAWVQIGGNDYATPVASQTVAAEVGDVVHVNLDNGIARSDGNLTDPAVGTASVTNIVNNHTAAIKMSVDSAEESAAIAKKIAGEAAAIASATGQHFWDDTNGAHVTDVTKDEWNEAVADDFPDLSDQKPYHNSLWGSAGMLFRRALNNLVSISRSAIAFFDGTGNQAANITARFGTDGFQVGMADESHLVGDYHSLQLIDKEGTSYFYVSDLRNSEGVAEVSQTFEVSAGAGTKRVTLSFACVTILDAVPAGPGTPHYQAEIVPNTDNKKINIFVTSENVTRLKVTYTTADSNVKAFTFGARRAYSDYPLGIYSSSLGYGNEVSGHYAFAAGNGNRAIGEGSCAIGQGCWATGRGPCVAIGDGSSAEGESSVALGNLSHAYGDRSLAVAGGVANDYRSIAAGYGSETIANSSFAIGCFAKTNSSKEMALGFYNIPAPLASPPSGTRTLLSVGNGTSESNRSNAFTIDWSGNVECGEVNGVDMADVVVDSDLAAVATSGAYSDLTGTPTLATVATSGDYDDLSDTPDLSVYAESANLAAVATSGAYSDLTGTPTLATVATSGSYNDLSNKPTILDDDDVPLLKGATALASGDDLDDIVDTGTYYANSNNAANISNCPVAGAFKLYVERTLSTATYLKQRFELYDAVNQWVRFSKNGGSSWGTWYREAPHSTQNATANQFLATPNGSAGLPSYRAIANGDLPTVDAAHGGTGQTTLSDAQEALANSLSTESVALTDSEQFIIREVGSTTKWHRRSLSALWSYIKGKASDIFPLLVGGTALASTDNLDNIKDVGTYYVTGGSSTPQNAPTGFSVGKVIVDIPHGLSSSAIRGQHYISYSTGREAYRKFESGSWSEWQYEYPRGPRSPQTYDVKSLITQTSTQSGNFTISAASLVVSGYVAMLTVDFTIGTALTANTEYSLGTLPTSIRPAARANAGIGDSRFYAAIANGTMYLRPQAATSAGTSTYRFNSTYIMSNAYSG